MCKKGTRHHHTLLHRDVDNLTPRKSENSGGKEEAHVAALSVSDQVLLMTFKVNVTTPDGSSSIVRALIDPRSSTSLVHGRIAQHLHLSRSKKNLMVERVVSKKNLMVERVGGTSMPTRGSIWFQVSGLEDDAEEIGVEAYMLKKITKDLPLHPIPLSL